MAFAGEPVKKNVAGKNNRDSGSLSPGKNVGGHSIGIVMIRERRLPSNILDRLPSLINVLKDNEAVQALYFFGSLSRGQLTPLSDLDVAILLDENLNWKEIFKFQWFIPNAATRSSEGKKGKEGS